MPLTDTRLLDCCIWRHQVFCCSCRWTCLYQDQGSTETQLDLWLLGQNYFSISQIFDKLDMVSNFYISRLKYSKPLHNMQKILWHSWIMALWELFCYSGLWISSFLPLHKAKQALLFSDDITVDTLSRCQFDYYVNCIVKKKSPQKRHASNCRLNCIVQLASLHSN